MVSRTCSPTVSCLLNARVEGRATRFSPAFPRCSDAVADLLGDEPSFEVRDGAEDVEHELAGGRGGVEALLEAHEVDVSGLELVDGLKQLPERTPEPGDAELIAGPGASGASIPSTGAFNAVRCISVVAAGIRSR